MNVEDFKAPPAPGTYHEVMEGIFARQLELMEKYQKIEQLPTPPVSVDHPNGQRLLRDFAWRTTEELAECFEAMEKNHAVGEQPVHTQHALEELADALHFFVELLIFAGITPSAVSARQWTMPMSYVSYVPGNRFWRFVYETGVAMNFLRNKAWKQSHVPTDEMRFRFALVRAFHSLIDIWELVGPMDMMWDFYFRKSEVNAFRQRSNY